MTPVSFVQRAYCDLGYRLGFAEWDIGAPQPDLVELVESGGLRGDSILDVGCGSGDNAVFLAVKGYSVTGVDASKRGIRTAGRRSRAAGVNIEFLVANALHIAELRSRRHQLARPFDCVIDFGLFHMFRGPDIGTYVENLYAVAKPGGQLIVLCFSEEAPAEPFGPRRVSRQELEDAFSDGWVIEEIRPARYLARHGDNPSWLALLQRADRGF